MGSLGSNARVTLFTRAKCRAKFKVCEKQNKMAALGFSRKSFVLASFRTVSRVKQFFKATASFPQSFKIENKYLQPALCYLASKYDVHVAIDRVAYEDHGKYEEQENSQTFNFCWVIGLAAAMPSYLFYTSTMVYAAGESDDENENTTCSKDSDRYKGYFAPKELQSRLNNLAKANVKRKIVTGVEEQTSEDVEIPKKRVTRSIQVILFI